MELIKSEKYEIVQIHFKHKMKENWLVFGRIPMFGSGVIIDNTIFTSGAPHFQHTSSLYTQSSSVKPRAIDDNPLHTYATALVSRKSDVLLA